MARRKLPEAATVKDILSSLQDSEEYVRGVLGNMISFKRTHAEPVVRIGTTGRGIVPHYRIEPAGSTGSPGDRFQEFIDHMVAFSGRNHRAMAWDALDVRDEHWSTGAMTYDEIIGLIGELRGFQRKK